MLGEVLRLVEVSRRPVSLEEIAAALGRPPSAIEGMLETLMRLGRIEQVQANLCQRCPAKQVCAETDGISQCYQLKAG
ncbi:MAG TPA: hypothetical protein ENL35_01625 [Chloroflexi bacterium]|nr:hypothetical protein [Chloroflexota bacterium]